MGCLQTMVLYVFTIQVDLSHSLFKVKYYKPNYNICDSSASLAEVICGASNRGKSVNDLDLSNSRISTRHSVATLRYITHYFSA